MAKSNFWDKVEVIGADEIWGEGANEQLKQKFRDMVEDIHAKTGAPRQKVFRSLQRQVKKMTGGPREQG
jgi:L-arabinose isomerase